MHGINLDNPPTDNANGKLALKNTGKKQFAFLIIVAFLIGILAAWFGAGIFVEWETKRALEELDVRAAANLKATEEGVDKNFGLLQSIPNILSETPAVINTLLESPPPANQKTFEQIKAFYESMPSLQPANRRLARYAKTTGGAVDIIWLMRTDGTVISSSSAGTEDSIVGRNYAFREYVYHAMEGRYGFMYAKGTFIREPGLFFSAPVYNKQKSRIIGVIAARANLSYMINWLKHTNGMLVDKNGVVFAADKPSFEMMALENAPVFSMSKETLQPIYGRTEFPLLKISPWLDKNGQDRYQTIELLNHKPYHLISGNISHGIRLFIATEIPFMNHMKVRQLTIFMQLTAIAWILVVLGSLLAYGLRRRSLHRQEEERKDLIHQLTLFDPLTGAYSRSLTNELVEENIESAKKNKKKFALLSLDLDEFKHVNDTFGLVGGDEVLKDIARRIQETIRESDTLIRAGGDEFIVILQGIDNQRSAEAAARKIQEAVRARAFVSGGTTVSVSASTGIAIYPDDGDTDVSLLLHAEAAMFHAKKKGRDDYVFYEPQMSLDAAARKAFEAEMEQGLEKGEFHLVYQPKYSLQGDAINGCEALIRWEHPSRGPISPAEFIPIAERSGFIIDLGHWVLHEATRQAVAWQKEHGLEITVAVNLSAVQFQRSDLVDSVREALEKHDLHPAYLELELTESMIMADTAYTVNIIEALREINVSMAIDDFGTGYSSLAYLKKFDVDILKIDREFVRELEHNPNDQAIVKAVIHMAHSIDYLVIAEGVENESQMLLLRELGCHSIQGYWFSHPLSPDEFVAFCKQHRGS